MFPNIKIIQADITTLNSEAIVNAAKPSLMGGGGVDGRIHEIGGDELYEACRAYVDEHGFLKPGQAALTPSGGLLSQYVIHTVGPVWVDGDHGESRELTECYKSVMSICVEKGIKSVAIPNISCGIYGFPKRGAARIALRTVREFPGMEAIDEIIFVCYEDDNYRHYTELVQETVL